MRKRVLWDESNLEANEEYRRQHPVTMHISEPKTPYVHGEFDEEGDFIDCAEAEGLEPKSSTWDPKINALARQMREDIAKEMEAPLAPISPSGRPMLSPGATNGGMLAKRHATEFVTLRRAVYADEGTNFKALLARKDDDDNEDDDSADDDDDNSDSTGDNDIRCSDSKQEFSENGNKNVQ